MNGISEYALEEGFGLSNEFVDQREFSKWLVFIKYRRIGLHIMTY